MTPCVHIILYTIEKIKTKEYIFKIKFTKRYKKGNYCNFCIKIYTLYSKKEKQHLISPLNQVKSSAVF
ncbi:MAG TPA: hypothetical protein DD413_01420 [Ruminococcus sp.]|nr:hypothetical protein [Ruminococcus sp.]